MDHACSSVSAVVTPTFGRLGQNREIMIKTFILEHLNEKLTVSRLSQICRLSRSHFSRAFKRSMGVSPQAWIREQRLLRAKNLIRTTKKSLTEISLECGFCDQAYFCHIFQKSEGINALAWRYQINWKDSLSLFSAHHNHT